MKFPPFSSLVALPFFILASCGQPAGNGKQNVQARVAEPGVSAGLCDSFAVEQFAMDTSRATALADAFLASYRHGDAEGRFTSDAASIAVPNDLMLSFEQLSPPLDPATQCLGVRIAYGLDEAAHPLFLFAPVAMTRTPSAEGMLDFRLGKPDKYYMPADDAWQLVDAPVAEDAMQRYATQMMKYVDGVLKPLTIDPSLGSASDPLSTFFPFTEFRALIDENQRQLQKAFGGRNDIPSITAIRLRWAAEKLGDDGTLKQIVVMLPVLDGPEYPEPDLPLTLKAADFNSLCPPHCAGGAVSYRKRIER